MEPNIVRLTCKAMRERAREALSGKWKVAVLATLVIFLISSLQYFAITFFSNIFIGSVISLAFSLFVVLPLGLGYYHFALKIANNEEVKIGTVFEGFNYIGKVIILTILIEIFVILWSILLIIPGIIAALRYSQAYFILLDNPEISPLEAIKRSKQMMVGNKGKYFLLGLSFIGWALLNGITCGVGSLWLLPYIYVALAVFYKEVSREPKICACYLD